MKADFYLRMKSCIRILLVAAPELALYVSNGAKLNCSLRTNGLDKGDDCEDSFFRHQVVDDK